MNIYLDIETIPAQGDCRDLIAASTSHPASIKKPETIAQWHEGEGKYAGVREAVIEERWRKTALDGTYGEIISIAWAVGAKGIIHNISRTLEEPEAFLIGAALEEIKDGLGERHPYFIGHNITFDMKFLFRRCLVNNISPPFKIPFRGRHDGSFFCTMEDWCGYGDRISQDNLCKALGIEGKPNDIDGSKVWDFVKAGDVARVAEYNVDDVDKVRQIHQRLTFS